MKDPKIRGVGWVADRLAVAVCALFWFLCVRYAGLIELWGDEAFSLVNAAGSWRWLLTEQPIEDAVHLPTYLVFLKAAQGVLGDDIFRLRLVFSLPFVGGLWFGYRALRRLAGPRVALATLAFAALIPAFVFYATNLRMYSLLFLAAGWYLDRLAVVVLNPGGGSSRDRRLLGLASVALVLADYPGVFLLVTGAALRVFSAPRGRRGRTFVVSLAPAAVLLVFVPALLPAVRTILGAEHVRGGGAVVDATAGGFDPFVWVKKAFVVLRPVLELTSPAQPSLVLAVVLPAVASGVLFVVSVVALAVRRDRATVVLVAVAFHWLLAAPLGFAIPRAFLSAMFFLPALLLLGDGALPRWLTLPSRAVFVALLVTNLALVARPVIPFYSRLPVRELILDVIEGAAAHGVREVRLSANTTNMWVIERAFLRDPGAAHLSPDWIHLGREAEEIPGEGFVFVSHLPEDGKFVDARRFRELGRTVEPLEGYVALATLPYNRLWKKQLLQRGDQPFLVQTWIVGPAGGSTP